MPRRPPATEVMEPCCPCCGAAISGAVALDTVGWFAGPTMAAIVHALRRVGGGPLHIEALAGAAYSARHGGPDNGEAAAREAIYRNAHKLHRLGWEVVNLKDARGYVLRKVERSGEQDSQTGMG